MVKDIAETVNAIASTLAILAAGGWFFYTNQFKQRIQFDVECRLLSLRTNNHSKIAEIALVFENKGFVEHRLWNLHLSVHDLACERYLTSKLDTRELEFKRHILPKIQLVPEQYGYYFVRPGVRQAITHIIKVPAAVSAIRVTASFNYHQDVGDPHTARRVFPVL